MFKFSKPNPPLMLSLSKHEGQRGIARRNPILESPGK